MVAEVRYQCFLSYGGAGESENQLRGMGVRFVEIDAKELGLGAPLSKDAAEAPKVMH